MSQNGQTQFNNFAAHAARFLKCVWPFTYIYTEREKETERQREMYVIMKTICPPGYHHNGFVATHALGHMMYGWDLSTLCVVYHLWPQTTLKGKKNGIKKKELKIPTVFWTFCTRELRH